MNNLKKNVSVVIFMACCLFCILANDLKAEAAALPESGTSGKCVDNVTWTYLDNDWVYYPGIYIDATGAIYDYEPGEAPWSIYADDLKYIAVCSGVTSVGKNAFYGMSGLRILDITGDVVSCDDTAMDKCNKDLIVWSESISVQQCAKTHGYQCYKTSLVVPTENKVPEKTISKGYLTYKITDSNEVSVTGLSSDRKNVVIPATVRIDGVTYKVTAIEKNAFKNNQKITKISIGKNIAKIGRRAFYNCKNVKIIMVKTSKLKKKKIGKSAFSKTGKSNYDKLVVKVPANKKKAYRTILKAKGLSGKAKLKGTK